MYEVKGAWMLPLEHISEINIVTGEHGPEVKFTLKQREKTEVVHLPILPELVERTLALFTSSFVKRE